MLGPLPTVLLMIDISSYRVLRYTADNPARLPSEIAEHVVREEHKARPERPGPKVVADDMGNRVRCTIERGPRSFASKSG
jgi:hypothetical protein